jgi:membrane protease YdiL (CAAX protease family)
MGPWFAAVIRRRPLLSFFVLTYALCAAAFFTFVAVPNLPYAPFWLVGVFSPTIVALGIAWITGGAAEVRRLLLGFRRWRFGWPWYLAAISLALIPLALGIVYLLLGNPVRGLRPGTTTAFLLVQLLITFLSGPLSEEAGWRGFALPRLQQRMSALQASLVLGSLWFFWHVPQYFVPNNTMIPFPIFAPIVLALAILFTWIYNNTQGSLVATVLAHFSFNFSGAFLAGHLGLLPPMLLYVGGGAGVVVWVAAILLLAGPKNLSRRPLAELPFRRREAGKVSVPDPVGVS